ncbi:MAG TPA: DUF481 domain-containing protein [Lacipirellulaceae bacterium]|nr:DUF481 domain-containing protein [Lacipirellulaceae bacterium]
MLWFAVVIAATTLRAQSSPGPVIAPPPLDSPAAAATEAASSPLPPPATAPASDPATGSPLEDLPLPAAADAAADAANATAGLLVNQPSPWNVPTIWLGPEPWDSGVELGLNGSSGTSDSLSMRTGAYMRRESRFSKLNISGDYNLTMSGGTSTQNNAQFDVCNDWKIDDSSPWTLFGASNVFYDKFAAYDLQTNLNIGVGYRFVHTSDLDFMGRVGGGTSRDFGGVEDKWVPEGLAGFEYSQKVSQTQKFYAKFDYYPEFDEAGEYRFVADTGWEIALVHPSNVSLKISASDRYDSASDGVNPQLLNYSVLLLLKL